MTTFEISTISGDENSDDAVDERMSPDEDGKYLDLWCGVSPIDDPSLATFEDYHYAGVSCYRPIHEDYDPEVCTAPFLDYQSVHR